MTVNPADLVPLSDDSNSKSNLPDVSGPRMNKIQYDIMTYCEQFYSANSRLPVGNDIESAGFSLNEFHGCVKHEQFNKALELRGIVPYTLLDSNGSPPANLTPEQLVAINTMMDPYDTRSTAKRFKDLELPSQRWNSWMRNPIFRAYVQQRGRVLLPDAEWEANYSLVNRVRQGDVGAIKYYNEMTGIYTPAKDRGVDVHGILFQVLEIIQKRISDPNTQTLIAQDLLALVEPVAPQLNGTPIINVEFKEAASNRLEIFESVPVAPIAPSVDDSTNSKKELDF